MLNIVIPMAGVGSRFLKAGFKKPKPFIDILGKTMIETVLSNIYCEGSRFILITRKEFMDTELEDIRRISANYACEFLTVNSVTEGACCTVLLALDYINNDTPLLIANCDQYIDINICDFVADCRNRGLDGSMLTFYANDAKWSYAKLGDDDLVREVKEKQVISNYATVGIYYFSRGRDFVNNAIKMIAHNDRVNNEFYTCPVYNYAIKSGLKIGIYNIDQTAMHGLGTPEDLALFIKLRKNSFRKY